MSDKECKNCAKCKTPELCHPETQQAHLPTPREGRKASTLAFELLAGAVAALVVIITVVLTLVAASAGGHRDMEHHHGRTWAQFNNAQQQLDAQNSGFAQGSPGSQPGTTQQDPGQLQANGATVTPADAAATLAFATQLVGMSETDAAQAASQNGYSTRVISRDGVDLIVTADYSPQRIDLVIDGGIVTTVQVG